MVDPLAIIDNSGVFARKPCKGCEAADEWCTASTKYTDRKIVSFHRDHEEATERWDRWTMQTRKKKEAEARKDLKVGTEEGSPIDLG